MPPKKRKTGSTKSKERKLKRKQEQEELSALLAKVKAAYDYGDFMEHLAPFRSFKRNLLDLSISFCRVSQMTPEDLKWAFNLMRDSVKTYYVNSGWGWSDKEKREELTHESACFLLARDSETKKLKAFVNFRFDLDEQIEVLYCYEIHLSREVQRKGLGKFLIQILELIGYRTNMKKVILTVFKENTISNTFFRQKLGYVDDETSPLYCDPLYAEEYSYSILSKALTTKKQSKPSLVAEAADQVPKAEGSNTAARKAIHEGAVGGRGMGGSARKGATSTTELATRDADIKNGLEGESQEDVEKGKQEVTTHNEE